MTRAALLSLALVASAACGATHPEPSPEPIALEAWRAERIELPPAFAPGLPTGEELLLFAPGMFDADSPEYWSYVFVVRVDEPVFEGARLGAFLEDYYDGLVSAVAADAGERGAHVPDDPARVQLTRGDEGRYRAVIDLIDAFVTMEPVTLHLRIDTEQREDGAWMWVRASPQAPGHDIWRSLDAAAESLQL